MLLVCSMAGAQVTINRATIGTGVTLKSQYTPEIYFTTTAITGGCRITDYNVAGGTDVKIPSTIGGLTVLELGDVGDASGAFENKGITSVTIPDTVTSFGSNCFKNNLLATVSLPPNWSYIDNGSFELNQLTGVLDLTTGAGGGVYIGNAAFAYQTSYGLTEVTISAPNAVVCDIGTIAFGDAGDDGAHPITKFVLGSNIQITNDTDMGLYGTGLKAAYTAGGAGTYNYSGGVWTKE